VALRSSGMSPSGAKTSSMTYPGAGHREVEDAGNLQGGLGAVVPPVDQDDRDDDQVGEAAHPQPEPEGNQDDHDRSADELGEGELPAHQQREHDAELDDQVGGGDLERRR